MNSLSLYTDLGCLFDERRAIITNIILDSGNKNFKWEMFEKIYDRRNMDYFNQPELGITQEIYIERHANRDMNEWFKRPGLYLPTPLITEMFRQARLVEFGVGEILGIAHFDLTINTFPYELTEEECELLKTNLLRGIPFPVNINTIYVPYAEQVVSLFERFDYVYKYDLYTYPYYENFHLGYGIGQQIKTRFILPGLFTHRQETDKDTGEVKFVLNDIFINEGPMIMIDKMNVTQGGKITFIPIDKKVFEYTR